MPLSLVVRARALALPAIVAATAGAYACASHRNDEPPSPSDGGTTNPIAPTDDATLPESDATAGCEPVPTAAPAATWDSRPIARFLADGGAPCSSDDAVGLTYVCRERRTCTGSPECAECLFRDAPLDGGEALPGPLLIDDAGLVRLNVAACLVALSGNETCGEATATAEGCLYAACTGCFRTGGIVAYESCVARARGGVCRTAVDNGHFCDFSETPDAAGAPCRSPGDFRSQVIRYGMLFCGKSAPRDASAD